MQLYFRIGLVSLLRPTMVIFAIVFWNSGLPAQNRIEREYKLLSIPRDVDSPASVEALSKNGEFAVGKDANSKLFLWDIKNNLGSKIDTPNQFKQIIVAGFIDDKNLLVTFDRQIVCRISVQDGRYSEVQFPRAKYESCWATKCAGQFAVGEAYDGETRGKTAVFWDFDQKKCQLVEEIIDDDNFVNSDLSIGDINAKGVFVGEYLSNGFVVQESKLDVIRRPKGVRYFWFDAIADDGRPVGVQESAKPFFLNEEGRFEYLSPDENFSMVNIHDIGGPKENIALADINFDSDSTTRIVLWNLDTPKVLDVVNFQNLNEQDIVYSGRTIASDGSLLVVGKFEGKKNSGRIAVPISQFKSDHR